MLNTRLDPSSRCTEPITSASASLSESTPATPPLSSVRKRRCEPESTNLHDTGGGADDTGGGHPERL